MKKILINLILVLSALTGSAQVKVLGKIEPNGPTDTYPTHVDSLGKGGLVAVGSWQERNAIPLARRKAGMLVRVKSATVDSTYTIGDNLTNTNWTPFTSGGTSITNLNQIPARSYNTLQDLPVIPDDVNLLHKTGNETKVGALTIADATNATNVKLINGQVHTISNVSNRGIFVTPTDIQFQTELGDFVRLRPSTSLGNANLIIPYLNGDQTIALRSDIPSPVDVSDKEDKLNKTTSIGTGNNISYPTTLAVKTELDTKLTGTAATNLLNPNNSKFPTAQTMVNALAGYEQNTNKATNLTSPNNATYPTTQAVVTGLTAKANLSGGNTFSGNQIMTGLSATSGSIYNASIGHHLHINSSDISSGGVFEIINSNEDIGSVAAYIQGKTNSHRIFHVVNSDGDNYLQVSGNGNVGIGTDYPSEKLEVNGKLVVRGGPTNPDDAVRLQDIPTMFIYSTITPSSGSTTTYTFPHGLGYTPTMVIATPNNNGALINCEGDCIVLTTKAEISGDNIIITCIGRDGIGPEGGIAVKWTIMVK